MTRTEIVYGHTTYITVQPIQELREQIASAAARNEPLWVDAYYGSGLGELTSLLFTPGTNIALRTVSDH